MYVWRIARALTRETKHPIWGELFKRVITGELRVEDIYFAEEIERPHPQWISIIAGANPAALPGVADFALGDFLGDVIEEVKEIEYLERALHDSIYNNDEIGENARLN